MKVFLRQIGTGLLFEEPDQWTDDADRAKTFRHSAEAMDHARERRLSGVEVLLAFEEPRYSVSIPLLARA